jgi:hypothetical protein
VGWSRHNQQPAVICHSYDGGKTWPQWDESPAGDGETRRLRIPGSVVRLPDNAVLITYGYRQYPFGVRALVSRDGGKKFDVDVEYILADSYLLRDCGYPSTVCLHDGTIITVAYAVQDVDRPEWGTCCIAYRYSASLFDAGNAHDGRNPRPDATSVA